MKAAELRVLPVWDENLPDEMKRRTQWVNWRVEERGGEPTKVPYTPGTEHRASSTDLTSWRAFEDALRCLDRYDGVGFVFCSGDPYVGVDLDGCVDIETGEVALWAMQIIEGLDSYTELSPSGRGVHIIAKGKIPRGGRRGPVEMYDRDRFFTLTGHLLGGAR